ncbi:MAG: HEAT repeat domain-containing protein [Thermoanaerobaculia bacterium]
MEIIEAARVLASRLLWTTVGLRPAGRHLVRALGSEDEDVRALAGMSLVQAGARSEALLEEALERRQHLPLVLTLLGDIGDPACRPLFERYARDPDTAVARAAREALRVLQVKGATASP